MQEQRKFARITLTEYAELADGLGEHWGPVRICNLSEGGVGLLCAHEIQLGSVRMLRFALPVEPPKQIRAVVRITHCIRHPQYEGFRLGGEFKELETEYQQAIVNFVTSA